MATHNGKIASLIRRIARNDSIWIAVVILASFLAVIPLLIEGIPRGTDLVQHFQFAWTYAGSIGRGDLFPGWAASENFGFGSIGIRFYPPIAYYLLAITQLFVRDWFASIVLNSFIWMAVGAVGAFLFARLWVRPPAATVAALVFIFAPYHRFEIYHFFLFGEFAAIAVLPYCFLALTMVIRRGAPGDTLFLAIAGATLLLTHIPTSIIGFAGMSVYGLFLLDRRNIRRATQQIMIGAMLALLANLFHLVRLVFEAGWVKHNLDGYTKGYYDFHNHLLPIGAEIKKALPPIELAVVLIVMGLGSLALTLVLGRARRLRRAGQWRLNLGLVAAGMVSLFLMSYPSIFIWERIDVLRKI